MLSTHYAVNCKHHQYAHGFMLIKLVLEARKAKIDWLIPRSFCIGDFSKDSNDYSIIVTAES